MKRMLLYFLSGVKPRLQLPCLTLKLNFILESKLDLLSKIFLIHITLTEKRNCKIDSFQFNYLRKANQIFEILYLIHLKMYLSILILDILL